MLTMFRTMWVVQIKMREHLRLTLVAIMPQLPVETPSTATPLAVKGIEPYVGNLCSDFYDFFVVNGSGTWQAYVPADGGTTCSDVRTSNGLAYIPVGLFDSDCNTATNPACWDSAPDVSNTTTHLVSSNLSVTDLSGTPFVAGAPDGPYDPTAINLTQFQAQSSISFLQLAFLLTPLFVLIGILFMRRKRS